jgi:hypothetical protein
MWELMGGSQAHSGRHGEIKSPPCAQSTPWHLAADLLCCWDRPSEQQQKLPGATGQPQAHSALGLGLAPEPKPSTKTTQVQQQ